MNSGNRILLGVNIDHCATLRQARYQGYERLRGQIVEPDPVAFALEAERAGADGITIHPREDGRHIQQGDVRDLIQALQVPMNMEMAATDAMVDFALEVAPATVCLVPEKREEVTTEGGLDIAGQKARIAAVVRSMHEAQIRVSLFIDPETRQIDAAAELGADYIELHTGAYANAWYQPAERAAEFAKLKDGSERARELGLVVNAGHGINYTNVAEVRTLPGIHEMNIGHSIVSRALFTGIREAVREMKQRINPGWTA